MTQQQLTEEELKNMSPEQIAELQKQNCPFCLIAKGKIPAKKVYEDEKCMAVLDINPANQGHIILFPKEHQFLMPQLSEELTAHISAIAKKLSQSLLKAFRDKKVEGTNIFIANGAAAGQKAPHCFIHIIPRSEGDGLNNFTLPKRKISKDDLKAIHNLLIGEAAPKEEKKRDERASLDTISSVLRQPGEESKEPEEEESEEPEAAEEDKTEEKESDIDLDAIANVLGK